MYFLKNQAVWYIFVQNIHSDFLTSNMCRIVYFRVGLTRLLSSVRNGGMHIAYYSGNAEL